MEHTCLHVSSLSCVQLFATPWIVTHQAPLSMGFFSKNTGVGCHFPPSGDLSDPGIEPRSPALQVDSLLSEPSGKPLLEHWHNHLLIYYWWLLLYYTTAELNNCKRDHMTGIVKILSIWPFIENVCQPPL